MKNLLKNPMEKAITNPKAAEQKRERNERLIAKLEQILNNIDQTKVRLGIKECLEEDQAAPTDTQEAVTVAQEDAEACIQSVPVLELGDPEAGPNAHKQRLVSIPAGLTAEEAEKEIKSFYAKHAQLEVEIKNLTEKLGDQDSAQLELIHTLLADLLVTVELLGETIVHQAQEITKLKAELFAAEIKAEDLEEEKSKLSKMLNQKETTLNYRILEVNDLAADLKNKEQQLKEALGSDTAKGHIITQLNAEIADNSNAINMLMRQIEEDRLTFKKAILGHKKSIRRFRSI